MAAVVASVDMNGLSSGGGCRPGNSFVYERCCARSLALSSGGDGENARCRIIAHLPTASVRKAGSVCTAKCAPLARLYTNGTVSKAQRSAPDADDAATTIRLTVNGKSHDVDAAPDTALLYVLRNDLALNGPKYGCGLGECGTCTVLIDGTAARSCVIPIEGCVGRDIVTLEGLGTREHPDPVQAAFIAEQAAQCGYCLNGMIMTTKALLRATRTRPRPKSPKRCATISAVAARMSRSCARRCAPQAFSSRHTTDAGFRNPVGRSFCGRRRAFRDLHQDHRRRLSQRL